MTPAMTKLLAALRKHRLGPTVTTHQVNGKTTFRWHVDNDDDRYVEAVDSLHSSTFVLHCRDGNNATITVVNDVPSALIWIDAQIVSLSMNPEHTSPTRPLEPSTSDKKNPNTTRKPRRPRRSLPTS